MDIKKDNMGGALDTINTQAINFISKSCTVTPKSKNVPMSTPSTIRSASTLEGSALSTPISSTYLRDDGSIPRRRNLDFTKLMNENKALKNQVYALEIEMCSLRTELPLIKNERGIDFSEDYIKCRSAVREQKQQIISLEEDLREVRKRNGALMKELDEERAKNKELKCRNRFSSDLPAVGGQEYCAVDEDVISQGDSFSSEFSILSRRDQEIEELKGKVSTLTRNNETKTKQLEEERSRCQSLRAEVENLRSTLEVVRKEQAEVKATHLEIKKSEKRLQGQRKAVQDILGKRIMHGKWMREGSDALRSPDVGSMSCDLSTDDETSVWDTGRKQLENNKTMDRMKKTRTREQLIIDADKEIIKHWMAAFDALSCGFGGEIAEFNEKLQKVEEPKGPSIHEAECIRKAEQKLAEAIYEVNCEGYTKLEHSSVKRYRQLGRAAGGIGSASRDS